MAQFSRALAGLVMGSVKALFAPSRGRHSARRRRSTRVRRYTRTLPSAARATATPERPSSVPRLRPAPSPTRLRAEEVALVRPYYHAHEQELRRVQERANARLHAWTTKALAPTPVHEEAFEPLFTPVRPLPSPSTPEPRVPAPRIPAPRVPAKLDQLTHLSRIRERQQQRRLTTTGEGAL